MAQMSFQGSPEDPGSFSLDDVLGDINTALEQLELPSPGSKSMPELYS